MSLGHVLAVFYSVSLLTMLPKNAPPHCQPAKLNVGATAAKLGISTRHLIRLANGGIPGLKKAANGRNFDWREAPETMKWLQKEVLIRKGKKSARRSALGDSATLNDLRA